MPATTAHTLYYGAPLAPRSRRGGLMQSGVPRDTIYSIFEFWSLECPDCPCVQDDHLYVTRSRAWSTAKRDTVAGRAGPGDEVFVTPVLGVVATLGPPLLIRGSRSPSDAHLASHVAWPMIYVGSGYDAMTSFSGGASVCREQCCRRPSRARNAAPRRRVAGLRQRRTQPAGLPALPA